MRVIVVAFAKTSSARRVSESVLDCFETFSLFRLLSKYPPDRGWLLQWITSNLMPFICLSIAVILQQSVTPYRISPRHRRCHKTWVKHELDIMAANAAARGAPVLLFLFLHNLSSFQVHLLLFNYLLLHQTPVFSFLFLFCSMDLLTPWPQLTRISVLRHCLST